METRCGGGVVLHSELEPGPTPSCLCPAGGYVREQGEKKKKMGKREQNLGFGLVCAHVHAHAHMYACIYTSLLTTSLAHHGGSMDAFCTSHLRAGVITLPCVFGPCSNRSLSPSSLGETPRGQPGQGTLNEGIGCESVENFRMPSRQRQFN